eukprot:GHVS01071827.1.p1 GENE.GHVS01071827.1~~GHVS01071827.1.p1  ORF type:complete len:290 (+),score=19.91 GHVS01071827.1:3-872(+)
MLAAGRVPCYFILCFLLLEATPQTRKVAMGCLLGAPPAAEDQNHHQPRKLGGTDVVPAGVTTGPHATVDYGTWASNALTAVGTGAVPSSNALTTTTVDSLFQSTKKAVTKRPGTAFSGFSRLWGNISPGATYVDLYTEEQTYREMFPARLSAALSGYKFPVVIVNRFHGETWTWSLMINPGKFRLHKKPKDRYGYFFNYKNNGTLPRLNRAQRADVLSAAFNAIPGDVVSLGTEFQKIMASSSTPTTAFPIFSIVAVVAALFVGVFSLVGIFLVVLYEVKAKKQKRDRE